MYGSKQRKAEQSRKLQENELGISRPAAALLPVHDKTRVAHNQRIPNNSLLKRNKDLPQVPWVDTGEPRAHVHTTADGHGVEARVELFEQVSTLLP